MVRATQFSPPHLHQTPLSSPLHTAPPSNPLPPPSFPHYFTTTASSTASDQSSSSMQMMTHSTHLLSAPSTEEQLECLHQLQLQKDSLAQQQEMIQQQIHKLESLSTLHLHHQQIPQHISYHHHLKVQPQQSQSQIQSERSLPSSMIAADCHSHHPVNLPIETSSCQKSSTFLPPPPPFSMFASSPLTPPIHSDSQNYSLSNPASSFHQQSQSPSTFQQSQQNCPPPPPPPPPCAFLGPSTSASTSTSSAPPFSTLYGEGAQKHSHGHASFLSRCYDSHLLGNQRKDQGLPRLSAATRREQRKEEKLRHFYCGVCEKGFTSQDRLDQHKEDDHINCSEPGCSFSGPFFILQVHKLRHFKGEDGNPVLESPQETTAWIESRRRNFPRSANLPPVTSAKCPSEPTVSLTKKDRRATGIISTTKGEKPSLLETLLRETWSRSSNSISSCAIRPESAFLPLLPKLAIPPPSALDGTPRVVTIGPSRRGDGDNGIQVLSRRIKSKSARGGRRTPIQTTPYTYDAGDSNRVNICPHFLKRKNCRFGRRCVNSHDIDAYNHWKQAQHMADRLQVPKRPPLIYQLLAPEVKRYEDLLIQSINYIVTTDFLGEFPPLGKTVVKNKTRVAPASQFPSPSETSYDVSKKPEMLNWTENISIVEDFSSAATNSCPEIPLYDVEKEHASRMTRIGKETLVEPNAKARRKTEPVTEDTTVESSGENADGVDQSPQDQYLEGSREENSTTVRTPTESSGKPLGPCQSKRNLPGGVNSICGHRGGFGGGNSLEGSADQVGENRQDTIKDCINNAEELCINNISLGSTSRKKRDSSLLKLESQEPSPMITVLSTSS